MFSKKAFYLVKAFLSFTVSVLCGVALIVFLSFYTEDFIFAEDSVKRLLLLFIVSSVIVLTGFLLVLSELKNAFLRRIVYAVVIFLTFAVAFLFVLKKTGVSEFFSDAQDLIAFLRKFGMYTVPVFIAIQFFQVVILPVPSLITVMAGVFLFGPFLGAVYSSVGIVGGSVCAFYLGRKLGIKAVYRLVGKRNADRVLSFMEGKDVFLLTVAFLLPFFPDDALCFVAGISSVSQKRFIMIVFITRVTAVFFASYSLTNSLIPLNTWWGIVLWALLAVLVILITAKINVKINSKKKTVSVTDNNR